MRNTPILIERERAPQGASLAGLFEKDTQPANLPAVRWVPTPARLPAQPLFADDSLARKNKAVKRTPVAPELLTPPRFSIEEVDGIFSNLSGTLEPRKTELITFALPFGSSKRHVNASTFKALAGHQGDNLLRKAGHRWQIVADNEVIDLGDQSKVFKLGALEIYS